MLVLLAGCGAAHAPPSPSPRMLVATGGAVVDVAGVWSGADWGRVVLNRDGSGTYTDTYEAGPGRIEFYAAGDGYEGRWRESARRFGTLRFVITTDGRTIRGAWEPDAACTIGAMQGGALLWTRIE